MGKTLWWTRAGAAALAGLALLATTAVAQAARIAPNETETGWLSGRTVQLFIHHPTGPGQGPRAGAPKADIFLIAPIDPRHPQKKGSKNPSPMGVVVVPYHDTVLPHAISANDPANCFGEYVERGPKGTARTVLTRHDPEGSGLVLAYALRTKSGTVPLTSQSTIKAAVAKRLLKLDPRLGFGGACWTGKTVSAGRTGPGRGHEHGSAPAGPSLHTADTFREVTTQFYFGSVPVDGQPAGTRGAGNELFSTGALYVGRHKVGQNVGSCLTVADSRTAVPPGGGLPKPTPGAAPNLRADCRYLLTLRGGTLIAEGLFNQTRFEGGCASKGLGSRCSGSTETLAVVGGTGRYVGAVGELSLTQVRYPSVSRLVLRLR